MDLADELCAHQLHMMMDHKLGDITTDTAYSSAHWHANEVTTIVLNASSGCTMPMSMYVLHTSQLFLFPQSNEVGLLWPRHTC